MRSGVQVQFVRTCPMLRTSEHNLNPANLKAGDRVVAKLPYSDEDVVSEFVGSSNGEYEFRWPSGMSWALVGVKDETDCDFMESVYIFQEAII